jgi:hypothetical protein
MITDCSEVAVDDEGFVGFFVDMTTDAAGSEAAIAVGDCFSSAGPVLSVLSTTTNLAAAELPLEDAGSRGNWEMSIDAKFLPDACSSSMKSTPPFFEVMCRPTYSKTAMLRMMLRRRTQFLLVNMAAANDIVFFFFYPDVDDADSCDLAVPVTASSQVTHQRRHVSLCHLATAH